MADNQNRYKEMERYVTCALALDVLLFILYLFAAGAAIIWLKVIMTVLVLIISGGILFFLYLAEELLRPRSLWMSTAAFALIICLFFSLILGFPCPPLVLDVAGV